MYRDPKGTGTRRYEPPSPSYCSEDELEREDFFLHNPDFEFDELPQPFRFLDKVLQELLDRLSTEIDKVEELKELKSKTKALPVFQRPLLLDVSSLHDKHAPDAKYGDPIPFHGYVNEAFMASATNHTIFVSNGKKLLAISTFTRACLAQADLQSSGSLTMLQSISVGISENGHAIEMVFAFIDSGKCHSFLFDGKDLFSVKVFEDGKDEVAKAVNWHCCSDSYLLAITKHHPVKGFCLELYRIPRDQWLNEYNNALRKVFGNEDQEVPVYSESNELNETTSQNIDNQDDAGDDTESNSQLKSFDTKSKLQLTIISHVVSFKPRKECSSLIAQSNIKLNEGGKAGSGDRTSLSTSFYDNLKSQLRTGLRRLSFDADDDINLTPNESSPSVHFLKRVGEKWSNEINPDHKFCGHDLIGIWWSSENQFLIYKVPKSARDGELQLEQVYTNADMISGSCVNEDTCLIAMTLKNNNMVIWNRLTGEPSRVLVLDEVDDSFMLFASLQDGSDRLLLGMKSGNILQINCNSKDLHTSHLTDVSCIQKTDLLHACIAPGHPSLLFVAKKPDVVTVFDLNCESAIFHFKLPSGFSVDPNVKDCFKFNSSLSMLLVFASKNLQYDYSLHGLYVYNMCINEITDDHGSPHQILNRETEKYKLAKPKGLETIALTLIRSVHGEKQAREKRHQLRWKEYEKELKKRI